MLEKTPRTGTKILASGGTRCNVTTTLGPDSAAVRRRVSASCGTPSALSRRSTSATASRMGVALEEAPLEKVFPRSGNARDVRDALEAAARRRGTHRARRAGRGDRPRWDRWRVDLEDGMTLGCDALVLAAGGMSYPGTGTTGDGYGWLRDLGLGWWIGSRARALTSPEGWVRDLTGIAWQGGGRPRGSSERQGHAAGPASPAGALPHHGLGPGAMDLSHHVARAMGEGPLDMVVRLDAFPDRRSGAVRAALIDASGGRESPFAARWRGHPWGRCRSGSSPRSRARAVSTPMWRSPGSRRRAPRPRGGVEGDPRGRDAGLRARGGHGGRPRAPPGEPAIRWPSTVTMASS